MDKTGILVGYNQFLCAESLIEEGQFSLSLFEDLNKLIESIVLYDEIILLGDYDLPSGALADPLDRAGVMRRISDDEIKKIMSDGNASNRFEKSMSDIFGLSVMEAEDAKADKLIDLRISPNTFDQNSYQALFSITTQLSEANNPRQVLSEFLDKKIFQTRHMGGHFYYIARSVLYSTLAETKGWDYAPDLLRLPVAALTFSQVGHKLPVALYDALKEKVESEVEALMLLGMPVSVFVPPMTARILTTVDSRAHYIEEIVKLRDKFSGFRQSYREFLSMLGDSSVTLKDKIDAKKKMLTRITGIIEQGESGHALNVKTVWDKLVSSSLNEEGTSTKLSLSGLASLLIDQLSKENAKGHAKALFDCKRALLPSVIYFVLVIQ
jgi:hypothetical protein